MSDKARTWRVRSQERAKGRYYHLEAGRASERVSIALKYCSEGDASAALQVMQRDENETAGTRREGRIVRLARTDPDAAASYLLGDPEALGVFGEVEEAPGNLPLSEYVDRFYGPHREATRPKTWRTERFDWTRIRAGIGHVRLKKVDEYVVDAFLEGLTKVSGAPATWNMRRKLRNAIRACLEHARRKKHITGVPPTFFRLEGSAVRSRGEPEPYTPDEVRALLDAASQPRYRALFAATIVLGLRPSEAVRLDWGDVDWTRAGPRGPDGSPVYVGVVHVRQGKTAQSAAAVPLIGLARTELDAW